MILALSQEPASSQAEKMVFTLNLDASKFRVITFMSEKLFQAFALAYMIGWLLARMPKRK